MYRLASSKPTEFFINFLHGKYSEKSINCTKNVLAQNLQMIKTLMLILLLMFATLQYKLWLGKGSFEEIKHLNQLIEVQREKNGLLQDRNDNLAIEVLNLKQGLDAIEERARKELGMIKKGEIFIQVIEE